MVDCGILVFLEDRTFESKYIWKRTYVRTFWNRLSNPPAPACQGHQGCGFRRPFAFLQSSVMLAAISHLLLSCWQARNSILFTPHTHRTQDPLHHRRSIFFKLVTGAAKACQRFQKTKKSIPKSIKRSFFKRLFCNTFLAKTEIYKPRPFKLRVTAR